MKKIVLEIDGVRHRLVQHKNIGSCSHCSIVEFCGGFSLLCKMPEYYYPRCNYVEEKDLNL